MRKNKLTSILSAAVIMAGAVAPAFMPSVSHAAGNPKIILTVPDNGGYDYLNGATYDVYLKYLLSDDGKLLDPKTGSPSTDSENASGLLPDTSKAHKMGTITINGQNNEMELTSQEAHLQGGALGRAIYTIVPVKRAPGYHLDIRPDGKYAEVEFPRLQDDGSLHADQEFTITLKNKPADKAGDLNLVIKRNEKGQPLDGMTFKLTKIGTPKKVGADNRIEEWEDANEEVGDITSASGGKLIFADGTALKEGKYKLTELNAKDMGFSKIGDIEFTYTADAQNKMKIKFLAGENSSYIKADGEAENGDNYSLYNYEDLNPIKEAIGKGGAAGNVNTVSPNTTFGYRVNFKFPADFKKYTEVKVEDTFDQKLKPLFKDSLDSVGGSDLANDISVWYEKPGTAEKVEIEKDTNYTLEYSAADRKLTLKFNKDQLKSIAKKAHNIEEGDPMPNEKLEEMGKVFIQFKAQVDGSKLQDSDFEQTQPGIANKAEGTYTKDLNPANSGPEKPGDGGDESEPTKTKVIRVKIKMMKTDKSGSGLRDAEFVILPKNDPDAEPLKPYDHVGPDPYTVKSDASGFITAEKLPYLKEGYYFKEIKAPSGFRLPKALFKFETTVSLDQVDTTGDAGQYDLDLGTHDLGNQIVNVKKDEDIVNTGTMGTLLFGLAGAGALGAGLKLKRKKRS